MKIVRFGELARGSLYELLMDAYSESRELVNRHKADWKKFDDYIYDHLQQTEATGFVTLDGKRPIGFISWDPRGMPGTIELGHNCIIKQYKGQGHGGRQLSKALEMISELRPDKVIVKTGKIDFFEPARRMYRSAGFKKRRIIHLKGEVVPEAIEFQLLL